jgi:hypothetical protein
MRYLRLNPHQIATLVCVFTLPVACTHTRRATAPVPPVRREWLDLEPGWRVRVVTPILRSGGYVLRDVQADETRPFQFTVTGADDFLGHETAIYQLRPRGEGVRVDLDSVEIRKEGERSTAKRPREPLFAIPKRAVHVRILHLVRASRSDHDAAILAAATMADLDTFTRDVQSNASNCRTVNGRYCAWVPAGIAVVTESRQARPGGSEEWSPL